MVPGDSRLLREVSGARHPASQPAQSQPGHVPRTSRDTLCRRTSGGRESRGRLSSRGSDQPRLGNSLAGTPATVTPAGTFFVTTAPAPTKEPAPDLHAWNDVRAGTDCCSGSNDYITADRGGREHRDIVLEHAVMTDCCVQIEVHVSTQVDVCGDSHPCSKYDAGRHTRRRGPSSLRDASARSPSWPRTQIFQREAASRRSRWPARTRSQAERSTQLGRATSRHAAEVGRGARRRRRGSRGTSMAHRPPARPRRCRAPRDRNRRHRR